MIAKAARTAVRAAAAKKTSKSRAKERPDTGGMSGEVAVSFLPVVAAFAEHGDVSQRRMFNSNTVLSVSCKIFAMFTRGRFVVKLPKERVAAMVERGEGEYFDPGHGRLMKEWIAVKGREDGWIALAESAYVFVKGAGNRPTRRGG